MSEQAASLRSKKDFWFACVDIDVLRDTELSPMARFIFSVICTFTSMSEGRTCWPSNDAVAKAAGVSKRTVIRALMELKNRGVIARADRFMGKGAQTSSYTQIVGHNAKCYELSAEVSPSETDDTPPATQVSHEIYQAKDIKDSLKGGDRLPENSREKAHEQNPSESAGSIQTGSSQNLKEVCTPNDAPSMFRPTAKYFLYETGRSGLTREDISALRKLAVNHTPARVQGEIDTACERFRRRGQALTALTFEYIAKSLEYQQSRKERKNKTPDATKGGITSADIESRTAKPVTAEENELIEAEIREGKLL